MNVEAVILSEASQRRRNIVWHPLYVESKKKWYKWTYLQDRKRLTDLLENKLLWLPGGMNGRAHTAIFQMDNQQRPTV